MMTKRDRIKLTLDKVFDKLMEAYYNGNGTRHKQLVDRYEKLVKREEDIMFNDGINTANPCPLSAYETPCEQCTGWHRYKKMTREGIGHKCSLRYPETGNFADLDLIELLVSKQFK